jgi:opacity protein-like surface antigen
MSVYPLWPSGNEFESFDLDRQPKGLLSNINLGYKINHCTRVELGLDYNPNFTSTAYFFDYKHEELGGHANFIRDFNSTGSMTPFIFGSLGYMRANTTLKPTIADHSEQTRGWDPSSTASSIQRSPGGVPDGVDLTSVDLGGRNILSYKIGAGADFKMTDKVSFQVKYSLGMREGFTKFQDISDVTLGWLYTKEEIVKNQFDHALTVGVRMNF